MKRPSGSLLTAVLATALLTGGCKAWRTVCLEPKTAVGREARTQCKYEITSVRYQVDANSGMTSDAVERSVEDLFGTRENWDRIMQYRPGVFESRGVPVTVIVRSWRRQTEGEWTWFFPFALTATIVPAFISEEDLGELEISVGGRNSRRIVYRGVNDWRVSCIGPLGLIPYSQPDHPSSCIWARNRGSISLEPVREGLADAIAAALLGLEKSMK